MAVGEPQIPWTRRGAADRGQLLGTSDPWRKAPPRGELIGVSGADPLNLLGILVPGPRLPAITSNRILFRDGLPVATLEAGQIRKLQQVPELPDATLESALTIGKLPASLRPYY